MKIGFDISRTGAGDTGDGRYADSLIRRLAELDSHNSYVLYPLFGDIWCDPARDETTVHLQRPGWTRGPVQKSAELARDFWTLPSDDFDRRIGSVDIVHANNFFCPTELKHARVVYTLCDLSFVDRPELVDEPARAQMFNGVFNASILADAVIAASKHTRDHFLEIFPHYPADRVEVVHPASRFAAIDPDLDRPAALDRLRPGQFWLAAGSSGPDANPPRLLEAYALLKRRHPDTPPLALVGAADRTGGEYDKIATNLGVGHDVIPLFQTDDRTLQWLYQNCLAFCHPTRSGGPGPAAMEAMSLGAPIIASNTGALPEIVGDAALLIDPDDAGRLADAMADLQTHPERRQALRDNGLRRTNLFDWKKSALAVMDIYRRVVCADMTSTASANHRKVQLSDAPAVVPLGKNS